MSNIQIKIAYIIERNFVQILSITILSITEEDIKTLTAFRH